MERAFKRKAVHDIELTENYNATCAFLTAFDAKVAPSEAKCLKFVAAEQGDNA
jgi:hypothetical protein